MGHHLSAWQEALGLLTLTVSITGGHVCQVVHVLHLSPWVLGPICFGIYWFPLLLCGSFCCLRGNQTPENTVAP